MMDIFILLGMKCEEMGIVCLCVCLFGEGWEVLEWNGGVVEGGMLEGFGSGRMEGIDYVIDDVVMRIEELKNCFLFC